MTKWADRVVAIVFIIVGVYILIAVHIKLPYKTVYGPGPGFLPFLLGICFIGLSIPLFIKTFAHSKDEEILLVKKEKIDWYRIGRPISAIILLFISIFLFETLGFFLAYVLLVFSLLFVLEHNQLKYRMIVFLSIVIPAFFILIFSVLLKVQLPKGFLQI